MTTESLWRLRCDALDCTATALVEQISDRPDGWTRIRSTAHLDNWRPGQQLTLTSGRKHKDQRTHSDIHGGAFTLHLCPKHPDVFADHLPQTEGATGSRGRYSTTVRCGGGWSTWGVRQERVVGRRPSHAPEWEWWQHLPAELQGYSLRDRAAA